MYIAREIEHRDIPAWYEVSAKEMSLLVKIHPDAADYHRNLMKREFSDNLFDHEKMRIPEFIEPCAEAWGFGGIAIENQTEEGWLCWEFPLPANDLLGSRAAREQRSLSATLSFVFRGLSIPKEQTSCEKKQLLIIDNMATDESDELFGGSFSVHLSKQLCCWLRINEDTTLPKIQQTITEAYFRMRKKCRGISRKHDFEAYTENPQRVFFRVPGDQSMLHPEHSHNKREGYTLYTNNVDSALQQLSLLMGVAALHDRVRTDGF